jgi:RNA polymerase sigma factor (sigma-70 family)
MADQSLQSLVRQVARTAAGRAAATQPDPELLRRFAADRDEAAFAALVARHGPVVLDVCRAVLGNHTDAEDAFQATFLLLARAAGSVRRPGSLSAWLHGVAYRTALTARTRAARRRKHEARTPARGAAEPDDLSWAEVRRVVHEELAGLGERYRVVIVLCDLDGLTQERAAAGLGLTPAAVKKRLERGRAMLRKALGRRGLGPAAGLAVAAVPAAGVPPALAAATARAASLFAAGPPPAGPVPGPVLGLVTRGSRPMLTPKLPLLLLPAVALGLALAPAGGPGRPGPLSASSAAESDPPRAVTGPADGVARPLAGAWRVRHVETGGKPAPELAGVAGWKNTDPVTLKGFRGKVVVLDFWSYSCSIRLHHKPDLARLADRYKDKGLAVLTIHDGSADSIEEVDRKVPEAVKRKAGHLPVALDGKGATGVFRAYGIHAVPAVILIDRDGVVVRRFHHAGDPELDTEVARLLKVTR